MRGQGCPATSPRPLLTLGHRLRLMLRLLPIALFLAAHSASGQEDTIRLRVAWGGGELRQWRGKFTLDSGDVLDFQTLGMEADEPGSMFTDDTGLTFEQRSPRVFDGVDIELPADLNANFRAELIPIDRPEDVKSVDVKLADVATEFSSTRLDDSGNRLLIRRSPGDVVRVAFERDTMLFEPGEVCRFDIRPRLTGAPHGANVRLEIELHRARDDEALISEERSLKADRTGSLPDQLGVELQLPEQEGVYDVRLTLDERGLRPRFVGSQILAQRKIQLVVIDSQADPLSSLGGPLRDLQEINPAHPDWWQRIAPLNVIPGLSQRPIGNDRLRVWSHRGAPYVQLDSAGWQAYPLSVDNPGRPHVLEIAYPGDVPQTLGISIVEPNAGGAVVPLGLDFGVHVPDDVEENAGAQVHRAIFWPRTENPLVLLTNRRQQHQAVFGKIRLYEQTGAPTPIAVRTTDEAERLTVAYYSKPLKVENFSATAALDPPSGRSLDDWLTFYQAGTRMLEYLDYVGYNAALISVYNEGSTLYPSDRLQPTPKYDTGVYFASGQDPSRKDVLEMLHQLFNRQQMKLIPALNFSSPLPALEEQLRLADDSTEGIRLVDGEGMTWVERNGVRQGLAPYYNPLDPRVQAAMLDVVREVIERYGHHSSFSGLAIQLTRDGSSQLPGIYWGLDGRTFARFVESTGARLSAVDPSQTATRVQLLSSNAELRQSWVSWRAEQLAEFHRKIRDELAKVRADARLYLSMEDMSDDPQLHERVRPQLPVQVDAAFSGAMLARGIDANRYREDSRIVLLRPRSVDLQSSPPNHLRIDDLLAVDRYFAGAAAPGTLIYNQPQELRLPDFDAASPFDRERSQIWLMSHITPSEPYQRREWIRSVALQDTSTMVSGGWMLPVGQEEQWRDVLNAFRGLPAEQFETVASDQSIQPVVVRRLHRNDETFAYVVNNSRWPVTISLAMDTPDSTQIRSLHEGRDLPGLERRGEESIWTVSLRPFDLIACVVDAPNVQLRPLDVELPESVVPTLEERIRDVSARAAVLRNPPLLDVLKNAGFEQPDVGDTLSGWVRSDPEGVVVVDNDNTAHGGRHSLKLSSDDDQKIRWVRSAAFQPPPSGRLFVWVYLRVDDATQQPPLRLSLEARHHGKTYYRWSPVGRHSPGIKLQENWAEYILPVDNLPPDGLTNMSIGFDLMGKGEVWIDDVRCYDLSFMFSERNELSKMIANCSFHLREGRVSDCARVLDSYWPRFLREHVAIPPAAVAQRPARYDAPEQESSIFDRFRPRWPMLPWFE